MTLDVRHKRGKTHAVESALHGFSKALAAQTFAGTLAYLGLRNAKRHAHRVGGGIVALAVERHLFGLHHLHASRQESGAGALFQIARHARIERSLKLKDGIDIIFPVLWDSEHHFGDIADLIFLVLVIPQR